MAQDKLIVVDNARGDGYRIQWQLAEEDGDWGDLGMVIGESGLANISDTPPEDSEDTFESWIAEKMCKDAGVEIDTFGFYWDSRTAASKMLKAIKESIKQKKPIPEWAKKALEAGWTPPKGWKA